MNKEKEFLSGNEAVAAAVALARPEVIAVYPITPQTTIVEKLAEWVANGKIQTQYLNMESEHSALSAVMGASAMGVRTFTSTSSQGLLYMSECLHYAAGGRFPIVMVNANRAVALPWSIFGDQRDSISQLESGWIQLYAENAQEALDLTLQSFAIAEHPEVMLPVMLNVDGFSLTHTYEPVHVPLAEKVNQFLPPYAPTFRMDLKHPLSLGFSAGPRDNTAFKIKQHRAQLNAEKVLEQVDRKYGEIIGRSYGGAVESYYTEDAERTIVTLGSISGLVRDVVDTLRAAGEKVGLLRLRSLRPFPAARIREALAATSRIGVLEKNVSAGYEGTVATHVRGALQTLQGRQPQVRSFTGGLSGRDISAKDIHEIYANLQSDTQSTENEVHWVDPGVIYES